MWIPGVMNWGVAQPALELCCVRLDRRAFLEHTRRSCATDLMKAGWAKVQTTVLCVLCLWVGTADLYLLVKSWISLLSTTTSRNVKFKVGGRIMCYGQGNRVLLRWELLLPISPFQHPQNGWMFAKYNLSPSGMLKLHGKYSSLSSLALKVNCLNNNFFF